MNQRCRDNRWKLLKADWNKWVLRWLGFRDKRMKELHELLQIFDDSSKTVSQEIKDMTENMDKYNYNKLRELELNWQDSKCARQAAMVLAGISMWSNTSRPWNQLGQESHGTQWLKCLGTQGNSVHAPLIIGK